MGKEGEDGPCKHCWENAQSADQCLPDCSECYVYHPPYPPNAAPLPPPPTPEGPACCSAAAQTCGETCALCSACFMCVGPQLLLPFCWPCAMCTMCLTDCAEYIPCFTSEPDCTNTLIHGGKLRDWKMGTETCASPPCPLLLVFHGLSSDGDFMEKVTQTKVNEHGGAIVVYPNSLGVGSTIMPGGRRRLMGVPGGMSCWSIPNQGIPMEFLTACGDAEIVDDAGFINAMLDTLMSRYSIDPERVYATGFSMGGGMTLNLACRLSHRIAAFVGVSPGFLTAKAHAMHGLISEDGGQALAVEQWNCPWDGRRGQIPLMIIHGTNDIALPYEPSVRTARWWATSMGYTQVEYPGYPCGDFSCTSTVWTAGGASPDATDPPTPLVAHIAVHGGDHAWGQNSGFSNLGAQTCTSGCFGTSDLALDFLFRYRSPPAPPSPPTLTGCRWDAPWIEECAAGCCSDTGESAICGGGHGMYTNPPCWECLDQTDGICAPCWEHCLPACADCYIKQPPSAPAPPMPPPPLGCRWENEECAAGCCASTGDAALCGGKHPSFDNPPCWECQYDRDGACAPCWDHGCLPDCSIFCYTGQPPSPPPPPPPPNSAGCRFDNDECAAGCCANTGNAALCGGVHPSFTNPPCWQCQDKRDGTCAPCWDHGCLPDCSTFCYNV